MRYGIQFTFFLLGLSIFSLGISMAIRVQYLGVHPWEVLNIALYDRFGLTIGTWNIIIGFILVLGSMFLDRRYINIGTLLNALLVGFMVDFFLHYDLFAISSSSLLDISVLIVAIILMGIGGGVYSASDIGVGPRDGFMLAISNKTSMSIRKVRILIECAILIIALIIDGPVFIFTFIYTFIQSPIYQFSFLKCTKLLKHITRSITEKRNLSI